MLDKNTKARFVSQRTLFIFADIILDILKELND